MKDYGLNEGGNRAKQRGRISDTRGSRFGHAMYSSLTGERYPILIVLLYYCITVTRSAPCITRRRAVLVMRKTHLSRPDHHCATSHICHTRPNPKTLFEVAQARRARVRSLDCWTSSYWLRAGDGPHHEKLLIARLVPRQAFLDSDNWVYQRAIDWGFSCLSPSTRKMPDWSVDGASAIRHLEH